MARAAEHYESHLAAVYLWVAGGMGAALSRGESEMLDTLRESCVQLRIGGCTSHAR